MSYKAKRRGSDGAATASVKRTYRFVNGALCTGFPDRCKILSRAAVKAGQVYDYLTTRIRAAVLDSNAALIIS
jgi:hypothetical protein